MANVCNKCGNNLYGNKTKCPFCGEPIRSSGSSNYSKSNSSPNSNNSNRVNSSSGSSSNYHRPSNTSTTADTGGGGWGLLGFCLPIVGIIMYFIWKDEKPYNAQALLNGALISIVIAFIFNLFVGCGSLM